MLSNSPLITLSQNRIGINFKIRSSYAYNFIGNFLKSYSSINNLNIHKTVFKNFQNSCIHLSNGDKIIENRVFNNQQKYSSSTNITNCEFIKCRNDQINGSAIYSSKPINILNCLFGDCFASFGSIYVESDISVQYCTFRKNGASQQSPDLAIRAENSISLLSFNIHAESESTLFGSMYREANGRMLVEDSNYSKTSAQSCVGTLEDSKGESHYKYVTFFHCSAEVFNGCQVITRKSTASVSNCNYIRNSHKSNEKITAAALLMYFNQGEMLITNSIFYLNNRDRSSTINFAYGTVGQIIDCCISGNIDVEVFSNFDVIKSNITNKACKTQNKKYINQPGFIKGRKHYKINKEKQNIQSSVKTDIELFLLSLAITFTLAYILGRIFPRYQAIFFYYIKKLAFKNNSNML